MDPFEEKIFVPALLVHVRLNNVNDLIFQILLSFRW